MQWLTFKAKLLSTGAVKISGEPVEEYMGHSTAGPSSGGEGSIFFAADSHRVRVGVHPMSPIEIIHHGDGRASCRIEGEEVSGFIQHVGLHCPRQAYMTVSERCIHGCRYCRVPLQAGQIKSPEKCRSLVESVRHCIDAISLTSGVADSAEAEERRVLAVVRVLRRFDLPIGVSIYPTSASPRLFANEGVVEVKWNIETATPALFGTMCPGLDWDRIREALRDSVDLFGTNRVFSNVIVGLGETDDEIEGCLATLTSMGVIPVLRPLTPCGGLSALRRPSSERLVRLFHLHREALRRAGLDTRIAQTMCTACTGCDLVPGRDA